MTSEQEPLGCSVDMHPVGLALIGAGPWGTTLGRALARTPEAELRWICDLDEDRLTRARAAHLDAHVTPDIEKVLADAGVDAAVVAVDSSRHHSVGLQVLRA